MTPTAVSCKQIFPHPSCTKITKLHLHFPIFLFEPIANRNGENVEGSTRVKFETETQGILFQTRKR